MPLATLILQKIKTKIHYFFLLLIIYLQKKQNKTFLFPY